MLWGFITLNPVLQTYFSTTEFSLGTCQVLGFCPGVTGHWVVHPSNLQTCHPVVGTGIAGGGGSIANGIAGGIAEIRERGVGDFIFGKLTVIFLNFSKILCI